jgi:hypothetical protein
MIISLGNSKGGAVSADKQSRIFLPLKYLVHPIDLF